METGELGSRQKIINNAAQLFIDHGYRSISMDEIAKHCGITKPAIYYYFKNKEDLFLAILRQSLGEVSHIVDEINHRENPPDQKMTQLIDDLLTCLPIDQRAIIHLASQEMRNLSETARLNFNAEYYQNFIAPLVKWFEDGTTSGLFKPVDPLAAVWILLGMLIPIFNQKNISETELNRNKQTLYTILFSGVLHAESQSK